MKVFGGPMHGQNIEFKGLRFQAMGPARISGSMLFCSDLGDPQETASRLLVQPLQIKEYSYYRERYAEQRTQPRRRREIEVAILEGAKLSPREEHELERDIDSMPWQLDPADSFLGDFEQWLAEVTHRHTGQIWWRRRRLQRWEF